MSDSDFQIGPFTYSHTVQKINTVEQKAVQAVNTTRTGKSLIVTSGESKSKAEVTFLFTGIDEINEGVRRLIALFKCCPIVSIKNEMLSKSWKPNLEAYRTDKNNYQEPEDGVQKDSYTEFVTVALEELSLSSVPDLPYSMYLTLMMSKVDLSSVTPNGDLLYQGFEKNDKRLNPEDAHWLKVWIEKMLQQQLVPYLTVDDFSKVSFDWYGQDILGSKIDSNSNIKSLTLNKDNKYVTVQSESCTISNLFCFHNLIGKAAPVPQHMGSTSRYYSVDVSFNQQDSEGVEAYHQFNVFKDTADEMARSKNRENRILGWNISSPISKLLNVVNDSKTDRPVSPFGGVFVPINIVQETSEDPLVKTARADLIENNVDFFAQNEVLLDQGGTDYDALKTFYDYIVEKEYAFRVIRRFSPGFIPSLVGQESSTPDEVAAYSLFWPVINGQINFGKTEIFGLLTRDTIKALFLHPDFDKGERLSIALSKNRLVSGSVVTGPAQVDAITRTIENSEQLSQAVAGPNLDSQENKEVYTLIERYIRNSLVFEEDNIRFDEVSIADISKEEFILKMARHLTIGFLGDYDGTSFISLPHSETGTMIQDLSRSGVKFSKDFVDTLFKVLIERSPSPQFARPAYDAGNIHTSFFKLITEYAKYAEINPKFQAEDRSDKSLKIANSKKRSLYPDLILPSYIDLYGEKWTSFAPTFSDFGIPNLSVQNESSTSDPQLAIAVTEHDIVSPSAWFFSKKYKPELQTIAKKEANTGAQVGHQLVLSSPFDTGEIETIKKRLETLKDSDNEFYRDDELSQVIAKAFRRARNTDSEKFNEDMRQLRLAGPAPETIVLYETNNGSGRVKRRLTSSGLGAEMYRVASELGLLKPSDRLPHLDQDSIYGSADVSSEYKFVRNSEENSEQLMKSMVDQIPDDYESPTKLFPSCKVYILEQRGTDLIGDDSFFTVNPIVSIDITMDKDDAEVAVIQVADPLFSLQQSMFPPGNTASERGTDGQLAIKSVLGSLKNDSLDGYLKRYKLAQGRAIQIRMGYDSNPENLKIVFTGKIAEINPGDVLTIVAQGWKVELINRQVAFYNKDPSSWGAKDLAVQAIQTAEPDGFGEHFPQRDANFLIRNLANLDAKQLASTVLQIQEGSPETYGNYSFMESAINSFITYFGRDPLKKSGTGLDTRLKNIWYPEIPPQNNFLGAASIFRTPFSYVNDSWTIPLQPCWDVLKEAARHTWGSIVQVVPYDGKATIFFGDPSQPYYFTKGSSRSRASWTKYLNKFASATDDNYDALVSGFKESNEYDRSKGKYIDELIDDITFNSKSAARRLEKFDYGTLFYSFDPLKARVATVKSRLDRTVKVRLYDTSPSYKSLEAIIPYLDDLAQNSMNSSSLPQEAFLSLQDTLKHRTVSLICKLFYNINELDLAYVWPSADRDIQELLIPSQNIEESVGQNSNIRNKIELFFKDAWNTINNLSLLNEIYDPSMFPSSPEKMAAEDLDAIALVCAKHFTSNDNKLAAIIQEFRTLGESFVQEATKKNGDHLSVLQKIKVLLNSAGTLAKEFDKNSISGISFSDDPVSDIKRYRLHLKAFIYYLNEYVKANPSAQTLMENMAKVGLSLPPTMQVFRVNHYIDSNHDIIKNNIVASTRDMWNTVAIEYPARDEATAKIDRQEDLYKKSEFYSGIKWIYYPKSEVTGVVGLQFHPGLTLANKKLKIFTELNCQSEPLAAKLACNRLAEGIRKMYRGSLVIKGRHIKPYDRIILNDEYSNMSGPIEVESVIHHWSNETGWICNIIPEAVCDANSGAAILQTAAAEALYGKVFKVIDTATDILTIISIIGTLGTATAPSLAGNAGAKVGIRAFISKAKNSSFKGLAKERLGELKKAIFSSDATILSVRNILKSNIKNPMGALKLIWHNYLKGPVGDVFKIQGIGLLLSQSTNQLFKMTVCTAFVNNSQKSEQLPIILSPLTFNGMPFLAGLETDDPIWNIYFNGFFGSIRDYQTGAEAALEYLLGASYSDLANK